MTTPQVRNWIESSQAEIALARVLASEIHSTSEDISEQCAILEVFAYTLANVVVPNNLDIRYPESIRLFHKNNPQLQAVNLSATYPTKNSDLTLNLFNRLAYELSVLTGEPTDKGLVNTPSILAEDMVAISAIYWISEHSNLAFDELVDIFSERRQIQWHEQQEIVGHLSNLKWYDPSVGTGAFPLAIIKLLAKFNIKGIDALRGIIAGSEIDPLLLKAAHIRIAFLISALHNVDFSVAMNFSEGMFVNQDALLRFTEQVDGIASLSDSWKGDEFYDIVIGNPPYVRAERLLPATKARLKKTYPSVANGKTDLYHYFIAHGIIALKPKGVLCYISPASFQKSSNGIGVRQFINSNGSIRAVFDFDELPVFDSASLHPSVYIFTKTYHRSSVRGYMFGTLPSIHPLLLAIRDSELLPVSNIDIRSWSMQKSDVHAIIEILESGTRPLFQQVGKVLSGVKTGHKMAFYLTTTQAEGLLADEKSAGFIRRLLRPVSIRTWKSTWDGTHIAMVEKGQIVPSDSRLMLHLQQYESELRSRSDTKGHPTWYGLRECNYYGLFEKQKIVFPDIASECRFAMDDQGFIIPDGAFMLPSNDYFLLGILNSCIGLFYFRARCNSIGNAMTGGRLRFKKTYVEKFPVPLPERLKSMQLIKEEIALNALKLSQGSSDANRMKQINILALQLYHIPERYWPEFMETI
jgi:hypothetical protein